MTKVYWPLIVRFLLLALIILTLVMFFAKGIPKSFSGSWILVGVVIYIAGKGFMNSFDPMWAYGEKGIEVFDEKGNVVKKYGWEDVSGIDKYSWGGKVRWNCPILNIKNGAQWAIWPFWTKNYRTVVKDVIGHLKKHSKAYIDPWVEKETKKFIGLF